MVMQAVQQLDAQGYNPEVCYPYLMATSSQVKILDAWQLLQMTRASERTCGHNFDHFPARLHIDILATCLISLDYASHIASHHP